METIKQYKISDYYPIAVGNTWSYIDNKNKTLSQMVSEIAQVDNVTIEKFVTTEGRTIFVRGNEGLNAFKIKMKGIELTYTPPISMSPQEISKGQCHTYDSQVTMRILGLEFNFGRISGATILLGEEDIVVPAGSFKKCLKFESKAAQKILFFKVESKLVVWFALATGGIRYDFATKFAGITFRSQQLMTQAKLGEKN